MPMNTEQTQMVTDYIKATEDMLNALDDQLSYANPEPGWLSRSRKAWETLNQRYSKLQSMCLTEQSEWQPFFVEYMDVQRKIKDAVNLFAPESRQDRQDETGRVNFIASGQLRELRLVFQKIKSTIESHFLPAQTSYYATVRAAWTKSVDWIAQLIADPVGIGPMLEGIDLSIGGMGDEVSHPSEPPTQTPASAVISKRDTPHVIVQRQIPNRPEYVSIQYQGKDGQKGLLHINIREYMLHLERESRRLMMVLAGMDRQAGIRLALTSQSELEGMLAQSGRTPAPKAITMGDKPVATTPVSEAAVRLTFAALAFNLGSALQPVDSTKTRRDSSEGLSNSSLTTTPTESVEKQHHFDMTRELDYLLRSYREVRHILSDSNASTDDKAKQKVRLNTAIAWYALSKDGDRHVQLTPNQSKRLQEHPLMKAVKQWAMGGFSDDVGRKSDENIKQWLKTPEGKKVADYRESYLRATAPKLTESVARQVGREEEKKEHLKPSDKFRIEHQLSLQGLDGTSPPPLLSSKQERHIHFDERALLEHALLSAMNAAISGGSKHTFWFRKDDKEGHLTQLLALYQNATGIEKDRALILFVQEVSRPRKSSIREAKVGMTHSACAFYNALNNEAQREIARVFGRKPLPRKGMRGSVIPDQEAFADLVNHEKNPNYPLGALPQGLTKPTGK